MKLMKAWAASGLSSTDSVMRSWIAGSTVSRSRASRPPRSSKEYAVPRSMRTILSKPHWWAMSVAFDDHGEIVPRRGVTTRRLPTGASPSGWAPRRSVRRATSSASSGALTSTKYQCSAASPFRRGRAALTASVSRARRELEKAGAPRSLRISDMARMGAKLKAARRRRVARPTGHVGDRGLYPSPSPPPTIDCIRRGRPLTSQHLGRIRRVPDPGHKKTNGLGQGYAIIHIL